MNGKLRCIVVASLLVLMFLSLSQRAEAAYHDVSGTAFEWPVTVLTDLEIMKGFADGTFRPGNPITRAEFAAVVVRACGLGGAAGFVAGATPYPDVPANHWASGYVNIASDHGFVQGFPDGTFRPAEFVSHAEAITVLVRILGYQHLTTGAWPGSHVRVAIDIGLIAEQPGAATSRASRGEVAALVTRALTIPVGDKTAEQIGSTVLIGTIPGVDSVEGTVVDTWLRPNSNLPKGRIIVRYGATRRTLDASNVEGIDDLLGQQVQVWMGSHGRIVLLRVISDTGQIVTGIIQRGIVSGGVLTSVMVDGRRYDIATNAVLYNNFQSIVNTDQRADQWAGGRARAVIDDGLVVFLDAVTYSGSWVVLDYCAATPKLVVATEEGSVDHITLSHYAGVVAARDTGSAASLHSIERHLVYYMVTDNILYLYVGSSTRRGLCESVSASTIVVDGREYDISRATLSLDDYHSLELPGVVALTALVGREVELHLGLDGTVRHVSTQIAAHSSSQLGVVINGPIWRGSSCYMQVLDSDGRIRHYRSHLQTPATDSLIAGMLIAYDHSRAGEIINIRVLSFGTTITLGPDNMLEGEYLIRTPAQWSRTLPHAPVFAPASQTVLTAVALFQLADGDTTARVTQSRPAIIDAFVIDGVPVASGFTPGVVTGWSIDGSRLYMRTADKLWDVFVNEDTDQHVANLTVGELIFSRVVGGKAEFIVPDGGTGIIGDVKLGGMYVVSENGATRFILLDYQTVVIDFNSGGVWSPFSALTTGQHVRIYDISNNGIADFVVVQPVQ